MVEQLSRSAFRVRLASRMVLALLALAGMWQAIVASQRANTLESQYQRLAREVGTLSIHDPNKVYVSAVPSGEKLVWRFHVYLPANYEARYVHYGGRISARTPRHNASGGWNSSGKSSQPLEFLLTIAALKDQDGWSLHTNTANSRGVTGLTPELGKRLESGDRIFVESAGQKGQLEVAADAPLCLLRIRTAEPVEQHPTDPLYEGLYFYLVPAPSFAVFEAAQRGTASPSERPAGATPSPPRDPDRSQRP